MAMAQPTDAMANLAWVAGLILVEAILLMASELFPSSGIGVSELKHDWIAT
jgi:hypothetical protein